MSQKISILINSLAVNPWLVVISAIISFLGLIFAVIFYFKSKKIKKPRLKSRSINLLKESAEKIDGLKITYLENNIPNITITKLAIWNEGNDTINRSDIALADPILITAKNEAHILEYKIIYKKNECNLFDIEEIESGKKIKITFDFLDFQDGAVIQILHTGNSSNDISFEGTIKGVGKVDANYSNKQENSIIEKIAKKLGKKVILKIMGILTIVLGVMIFIIGLGFEQMYESTMNPKLRFIVFSFMSIIYILTGFKIIRSRVPKGFEIFEENI